MMNSFVKFGNRTVHFGMDFFSILNSFVKYEMRKYEQEAFSAIVTKLFHT